MGSGSLGTLSDATITLIWRLTEVQGELLLQQSPSLPQILLGVCIFVGSLQNTHIQTGI